MTTTLEQIHSIPEYEKINAIYGKKYLESLKQYIQQYGQRTPIVINQDGCLLDGHKTFSICKELNIIPKYEVRKFADKLDDISNKLDEKEFVVRSDVNPGLGEWQRGVLGIALEIVYIDKGIKKPDNAAGRDVGISPNKLRKVKETIGYLEKHITYFSYKLWCKIPINWSTHWQEQWSKKINRFIRILQTGTKQEIELLNSEDNQLVEELVKRGSDKNCFPILSEYFKRDDDRLILKYDNVEEIYLNGAVVGFKTHDENIPMLCWLCMLDEFKVPRQDKIHILNTVRPMYTENELVHHITYDHNVITDGFSKYDFSIQGIYI